jgi:hypothetical protein
MQSCCGCSVAGRLLCAAQREFRHRRQSELQNNANLKEEYPGMSGHLFDPSEYLFDPYENFYLPPRVT